MLTDRELQSLRNLGNEAEAAAEEIAQLRAELADAVTAIQQAVRNERERCASILEREARGWLGEIRPSDLEVLAGLLRTGA